MTDLDLRTVIENLEFRIVRLTELMDASMARSRNLLALCEKANAHQAVTILELRSELADAVEGIDWRNAEIAALKRSFDSLAREQDRLASAKFASVVQP